MVKRLGDLMLILFPLIALVVVLLIFREATAQLDHAWQQQNGTTP